MPLSVQTISLDEAKRIVEAGERHAVEIGVKSTIVVVDRAGDLVTSVRMDGSWRGALDLALGKASVASAFEAPSGYFTELVQPGAPLFGIGSVAGGRYLPLPGGLPITGQSGLLGAVGVSGGTPEQDEAVARAAVERYLPS